MSKNRIGRINEEIRNVLADALRRIKDPRVSGLVSIVRCEATGDLRFCKVYVSVLGETDVQKDAIKGLKSAAGWLRRELSQGIDLRYTPELLIELDTSIAHGANISSILNKILPEQEKE